MSNIFQQAKSQSYVEGIVTFTVCDASSRLARLWGRAIDLAARIRAHRLSGWLLRTYHSRFMVRQVVEHNIVPTVGRSLLAQAITAQLAAITDIEVNYTALGTGTTTPANGDTTLVTETYRKLVASQSYSSNIAYNTAFYLASDTNGTFYEHGIFINGTASADSGTLFSRVLLNNPTGITKSASETLTVEHQHTFS